MNDEWNGWHLSILNNVSQAPLITPNRSIAIIEYLEQVGRCTQDLGRKGEMQYR